MTQPAARPVRLNDQPGWTSSGRCSYQNNPGDIREREGTHSLNPNLNHDPFRLS